MRIGICKKERHFVPETFFFFFPSDDLADCVLPDMLWLPCVCRLGSYPSAAENKAVQLGPKVVITHQSLWSLQDYNNRSHAGLDWHLEEIWDGVMEVQFD